MKKNIKYIIGTAAVLIILSGLWVAKYTLSAKSKNLSPNNLPGIQTGQAPWSAEITNLRKRLTDIGLPALTQEGTVLHIHQHIDIFINGQTIPVPAGIGIDESAGFLAPIHVHDNTKIIHVESPAPGTFTLGQFFDIWGVRLTSDCIGGYCNLNDKTLKIFINGNQFSGDPRTIALQSHQEIVVTFGTTAELPNPIPSSYSFPPGY